MTNMQDREKAFEAKFALDEELRFKAEARRNKLLGLWAAELSPRSRTADTGPLQWLLGRPLAGGPLLFLTWMHYGISQGVGSVICGSIYR
jgi:hypothetical protein